MHQMACPMDWGTSNVTTGRDLNPKNFTVDCFAFQLNKIPIHEFKFEVLEIVQGIDEAPTVLVVAFCNWIFVGGRRIQEKANVGVLTPAAVEMRSHSDAWGF